MYLCESKTLRFPEQIAKDPRRHGRDFLHNFKVHRFRNNTT